MRLELSGPDRYLAGIAKKHANDMAIRVTSKALQVYGGYGFTDENRVLGFYRGARHGCLGGGTTKTHKNLIGKRIYSQFPVDGFLGAGGF